jgi:hypothetical protein
VAVTTALPDDIVEEVLAFPESHMGVHRIAVVLREGQAYRGVEVAWGRDVLSVEGYEVPPFDASDVVSVADDSRAQLPLGSAQSGQSVGVRQVQRQFLLMAVAGSLIVAVVPLAIAYCGLRWGLGYEDTGLLIGLVPSVVLAAYFAIRLGALSVRLWRDQKERGWPGRQHVGLREFIDAMQARNDGA